ncbi:MAG: GTP-binding protein, partial [Methyloprofundus sp.]|nr:GTP-binding protein [Methyloprofundus sp.]
TVKEISGGCLCCATALPFQTSINRLLKEVKPDRLLIEPTGLGHPKKVLDMLMSGAFKEVLDVRASICLVDPEKLKDKRYTTHENFIDQIALSDILVANKMDLADAKASELFYYWAKQSRPEKALIAQTTLGQLDIAWLDIIKNPQRHALFPNAHKISKISPVASTHQQLKNEADGYQSFGYIFPPHSCFDEIKLDSLFSQLKVERVKGIFCTDHGWFIVNGADGIINKSLSSPATTSRVEIIAMQNHLPDILSLFKQCRIDAEKEPFNE